MTLHQSVQKVVNEPFHWIFMVIQYFLSLIFSPTPPTPQIELSRPRIAIIGAGLTGVSSASHCVGHGFDVTLFEAGPRQDLGGIWAKVWPLLYICPRMSCDLTESIR